MKDPTQHLPASSTKKYNLIVLVSTLVLAVIASVISFLALIDGAINVSNTLLPGNIFSYEGPLVYVLGPLAFILGVAFAFMGVFKKDVQGYDIHADGKVEKNADGCMAQIVGSLMMPFIMYALLYYLFFGILELGVYLLPYIIALLLLAGVITAGILLKRQLELSWKIFASIALGILAVYGSIAYFISRDVSLESGFNKMQNFTNQVSESIGTDSANDANTPEEFRSFLKKFTSSAKFQYSRVKFPLNDIIIGDEYDEDPETVPYTREKWALIDEFKEFRDEKAHTIGLFTINDENKIEYKEGWIESEAYTWIVFNRIENKWYLTHKMQCLQSKDDLPKYLKDIQQHNTEFIKSHP